MSRIANLALSALILTSCASVELGNEISSDPVEVAESFWSRFLDNDLGSLYPMLSADCRDRFAPEVFEQSAVRYRETLTFFAQDHALSLDEVAGVTSMPNDEGGVTVTLTYTRTGADPPLEDELFEDLILEEDGWRLANICDEWIR